jgi:hypothetical protein
MVIGAGKESKRRMGVSRLGLEVSPPNRYPTGQRLHYGSSLYIAQQTNGDAIAK